MWRVKKNMLVSSMLVIMPHDFLFADRAVQRSLVSDLFYCSPSDLSLQYELVTPAGFSGLFPRIGGGIHFLPLKISSHSCPLILGIGYLPGHSIVKFERRAVGLLFYFGRRKYFHQQ
jgi:hypothetical protein